MNQWIRPVRSPPWCWCWCGHSQMQGYPIGNSRVRLYWGRSQNNSGVGTPYQMQGCLFERHFNHQAPQPSRGEPASLFKCDASSNGSRPRKATSRRPSGVPTERSIFYLVDFLKNLIQAQSKTPFSTQSVCRPQQHLAVFLLLCRH